MKNIVVLFLAQPRVATGCNIIAVLEPIYDLLNKDDTKEKQKENAKDN